jgi:hypothetical protein
MLPAIPLVLRPAQPFETAEPACPRARCADPGARCEGAVIGDMAVDAIEDDDSDRENPENDDEDCAAEVHAANRVRMFPTFSLEGNVGGVGDNAGCPCPSPSWLLLDPAPAVTLA